MTDIDRDSEGSAGSELDLMGKIVQANSNSLANINRLLDANRRADGAAMARAFLRLLGAIEQCSVMDRNLYRAECVAQGSRELAHRLLREEDKAT